MMGSFTSPNARAGGPHEVIRRHARMQGGNCALSLQRGTFLGVRRANAHTMCELLRVPKIPVNVFNTGSHLRRNDGRAVFCPRAVAHARRSASFSGHATQLPFVTS